MSRQSKIRAHIYTHLSIKRVRHREGGCYPTIRVDSLFGQTLDKAGDRITDVLGGREYDRAREQQHGGEDIVHPKHHRVRADFLSLQILT